MTKSSKEANYDLLKTYIGVMELVEHGVMWLTSSGKILGVNEQFAKDLGYDKSSFSSKSIFEISPFTNLIHWKKLWKKLLDEKSIMLETEHITADGIIYPVRLKGVLIETGKDQVCCGIVENLALKNPLKDLLNLTSRVSNIGSWQWNLLDHSILFTEEMYRLLNIPSDFSLTESSVEALIKDRFEPEDVQRLLQELEQSIKTGNRFTIELVHKGNSEKEVSYFQMIGVPVFLEGSTFKVFGILQDINHISSRTKDMHLTQFAVDKASDLILWCGPDGYIQYVNQQTCQKLGYAKHELLKIPLSRIWPDIDLKNWQAIWRKICREYSLEKEGHFLNKSSQQIPVEMVMNYLDNIEEQFICIIARDVSKKIRRDELIHWTYFTLDKAKDMIYWLRNDGSFIYVNETFCETLGYSEKEVMKMKLLDFFPEWTKESFRQGWEALKNKEVLTTDELFITAKNGKKIPVENFVRLIEYQGEECSVVILRNISQQKKKEKELQQAIDQIKLLNYELKVDNQILLGQVDLKYSFNNIISKDPNYKKVLKQVEQVSDTDSTVLIYGETGTGKELLAQSIHQLSDRAGKPMIKINCGAIPANLMESELFGHEKGAFTSAHQQKKGQFELAHKGTIFLDEIGELPLELQPKLLRVLQEGEFQRVGGTKMIKVDVRVVTATNRNLEKMCDEGRFREDLYYRLNVFPIYNIPLRERTEDIPLLVKYFVNKINKKTGKNIEKIPQKLVNQLLSYPFPGNVRELENIIERAVILSKGKTLKPDIQLLKKKTPKSSKKSFLSMEEMQKEHILRALKKAKGKVSGPSGAAELLQMNDKTLISRMKKLDIKKNDYRISG